MIRLHYKYIYNKIINILVIILIVLFSLYFLYEVDFLSEFKTRWFNQYELYQSYSYNSIFIIKLIIPVIAIYLFSISFMDYYDGYKQIILKNRNDRILYFITKLLVIIYILFIVIFVLYLLFTLIGYLYIPNFLFYKVNIIPFINIFITSIIFGLISQIFVQLYNNHLSYILVIILYILLQMITDSDVSLINFISIILPIINSDYSFSFNYAFVILQLFLSTFINLLIYYIKDF